MLLIGVRLMSVIKVWLMLVIDILLDDSQAGLVDQWNMNRSIKMIHTLIKPQSIGLHHTH